MYRLNALMNKILQQHNITYGLPAYLHSLGCFEAGVSLGDNGLLPLSKDWSLFDESEMKSVSCWSNYFCQSEICHLTCFCFHLENAHVQCTLRWLDWIFLGGYLPRWSFNYVGMSKHMGKRLPQLHYIKMKISFDLGFIAIGVTMDT